MEKRPHQTTRVYLATFSILLAVIAAMGIITAYNEAITAYQTSLINKALNK